MISPNVPSGSTIKVASYNIHKGIGLDRRRDPDRILDVLREIDADVVALQEADRRFGERVSVIPPHLLEERSTYAAAPLGHRVSSMGWHGNVILHRRDDPLAACAPLHLPALEPRGAVMADVQVRGAPLRVLGMHLDLSGLWRRRQAAAILAHVQNCADPLPTVMMGDLNEWGTAGCLRDFARGFAFAPTGASFHVRRAVGKLDRIMVSPELRILDCGVHTSATARKASDHFPIWAVLELA